MKVTGKDVVITTGAIVVTGMLNGCGMFTSSPKAIALGNLDDAVKNFVSDMKGKNIDSCEVKIDGKKYVVRMTKEGKSKDMYDYGIKYNIEFSTGDKKTVLGPMEENIFGATSVESLGVYVPNASGKMVDAKGIVSIETIKKLNALLDSARVKIVKQVEGKIVGSNLINNGSAQDRSYLMATRQLRNQPLPNRQFMARQFAPQKTVPRTV